MIKKAIAVLICMVIAAVCFAACTETVSDEELHREVVGVWVPDYYDLTTTNPFVAVMITNDRHYLYSFSGGEIGSRSSIGEEGTTYEIKDGYFVINTNPFEEGQVSEQKKALISFPDRNTMLWGSGAARETYRRMTDDEIAYFGLDLGYYNLDYRIDGTNLTIPMTGGDTTTGGSGTLILEGAAESSIKPYLDFYATSVPYTGTLPEENTTSAPAETAPEETSTAA
jgi:hypothetical protein